MPNKYLDSEGLAEYTTLVKTALDTKAPLASPALTGTPTAPTPAVGDDSTKIATTEFVNTKAGNYLPLSGGTMTGLVNFGQNLCVFTKHEHSSSISIVGSSTDSGLGILSKKGSFSDSNLILRSGDQTGVPSFTLTAGNGSTSKAIVGKPDGTLTWDGVGLGGTYLGSASSGVATQLTLPKAGTYLVITGHNSTAGSNSIFIVRTGGDSAFKMAGGSNITMTCSGTQLTVTSSSGSVGVYYIYLG